MENQEQPTIQPQAPVQSAPQPIQATVEPSFKPNNPLPKWPLIIVCVILLATLLTGAYLLGKNHSAQIACTTEAKLCPDGSAVGRTGPKCEFAACPKIFTTPTSTPDPTASWKTYTGKYFTISLPKDFNATKDPIEYAPSVKFNEKEYFTSLDGRISFTIQVTSDPYPLNQINGNTEKILLNNEQAVKLTVISGLAGNLYQPSVQSNHNNLRYYFQLSTDDNTQNRKIADEILKNIIASFKFTDQTAQADETANWKTYTGTGYSVKYPTTWFTYVYPNGTSIGNSVAFSDILNPQDIPLKVSPTNHSLVQISYILQQMPSCFPYDNGGTTCVNPTIKPFTINGYSGIRGQQESVLGLNEVVYLTNPKGGHFEILNQIGNIENFNAILSTFKFTQ